MFDEYEPEDRVQKLIKKSKESPLVPVGEWSKVFQKKNEKKESFPIGKLSPRKIG